MWDTINMAHGALPGPWVRLPQEWVLSPGLGTPSRHRAALRDSGCRSGPRLARCLFTSRWLPSPFGYVRSTFHTSSSLNCVCFEFAFKCKLVPTDSAKSKRRSLEREALLKRGLEVSTWLFGGERRVQAKKQPPCLSAAVGLGCTASAQPGGGLQACRGVESCSKMRLGGSNI